MLPLVYKLLRGNAEIKALVDTRIYRHDIAPLGTERPYITWFLVSGRPEQQLSGTPCADFDLVQIDVWSEDDAEVERLARLVRDTCEAEGLAVRIAVNGYEPETKLFRLGLEVDVIRSREFYI